MIVLASTLAGFTILIGSWGIQLAMFIALLLFVPCVQQDGADETGLSARGVQISLLCSHALGAFVAFVNQPSVNFVANRTKYGLSIVSVLFYAFSITQVCMEIMTTQPIDDNTSMNQAKMTLWFEIELFVFLGILLSNILYLIIRSCFSKQVQLDIVAPDRRIPGMDSIRANNALLQTWMNFMVPVLTSTLIVDATRGLELDEGLVTVTRIKNLQYFQGSVLAFMIFVNFRRGPSWWTRYAYKLYYCLAWVIFVFIPVIEWIWLYGLRFNITFNSFYSDWLLCETFMQIQPLFVFFITIRKYIFEEGLQWIFWKSVKDKYEPQTVPAALEEEGWTALNGSPSNRQADSASDNFATMSPNTKVDPEGYQKFPPEEAEERQKAAELDYMYDRDTPYEKAHRCYGQGPIRINDTLNLRQDLFALCFVGMLRDDILDQVLEVNTITVDGITIDPQDRESSPEVQQMDELKKQEVFTKLDEQMRLNVEIRKFCRTNIFMHMVMCFAFQAGLIILLFVEFFETESAFSNPASNIGIILARSICVFILHILLQDEFGAALELMKYSANNPNKFSSSSLAFLVGFCQATAVLGVEILSVTVCLTSSKVLDVVMNFIALAIIADFDDFIYGAIRGESLKDALDNEKFEEIFTVNFTTSRLCPYSQLSEVNADAGNFELNDEALEDGKKLPLRIAFGQRTWSNKVLAIIYRIYRILFVSVYFYFIPFYAMVLSFLLPYLSKYSN